MLHLRYRLTIDYDVTLVEIDEFQLKAHWARSDRQDLEDAEVTELEAFNIAVREALVANRDILHDYIRRLITEEVEMINRKDLAVDVGLTLGDDNEFRRVLPHLKEDPHWILKAALRTGQTAAQTELLYESIDVSRMCASITEVARSAEANG